MIKIIVFVLVSQMSAKAIAQPFIEAQEKPLAKDAGRVLKLNEIYRVTSESGKFYFKYPGNLRIAPDGTFFVADEYQLLHFSKDGKFIRNIYKNGQGPGEIVGSFDYHIRGDEIYIFNYGSNNFFRINFEGDYMGNIEVSPKLRSRFLGVIKDDLVVLDTFAAPNPDFQIGVKSAAQYQP